MASRRGSTSTRTIRRWATPRSAPPGRSFSSRSRAGTARVAASSPVGPEWPIRRWQIWNEPNFATYWESPQSPRAYGELVKLSAPRFAGWIRVRRSSSPASPPFATACRGRAFCAISTPCRGITRSFDFVGFHPYSQNIRILRAQIERIRRLLARVGDRRARLAVTEIGWASDGERPRPLVVGAAHAGGPPASIVRACSRERDTGWHISDVQWYAWQDSHAIEDGCVFCEYAGLFDSFGRPKPAWAAFRRAVSGYAPSRSGWAARIAGHHRLMIDRPAEVVVAVRCPRPRSGHRPGCPSRREPRCRSARRP